MKYFVLTNNPMVPEKVAPGTKVVFEPASFRQILEEAARYIEEGHRLLTHPLSGSVKPGETPYKSMLMADEPSKGMDATSVQLISSAIAACDKFVDKSDRYNEQTLRDLQVVDLSLIDGAMSSAQA